TAFVFFFGLLRASGDVDTRSLPPRRSDEGCRRTGSGALRCHSPPHNKDDIDTSNCACPEKLTIYKKLTCEDRRIELCRTFGERRFDAMIYGQPDALPPPHGVFVGTGPASVGAAGAVKKTYRPSYMRVDPRIHWSHNRSDKWFEQKMEEIKARGGRKANFGKAAHRMRMQRIATERREAEDAPMGALAEGRDRIPLVRSKPTEPWSHHRQMDFGDVPAHELTRRGFFTAHSSLGAGKIDDFPQSIIVGAQSSSKPSVPEAISYVHLPAYEGACTRLVAERILRDYPSINAIIRFADDGRPPHSLQVLTWMRRQTDQRIKKADGLSDVKGLLRLRLQYRVGLLSSSVDLPGIFHSSSATPASEGMLTAGPRGKLHAKVEQHLSGCHRYQRSAS
ncbi:hypothetical protein CABS01_16498, partial [Colletotrichum abscissum]|uniref:uncharacterized protein n=1 Tax=Colletotrichum abscissum TaxID=1671311 RepID=UPI0027D4B422